MDKLSETELHRKVTSQMSRILNDRDVDHSTEGIYANYEAWRKNKGPLVDLLRNHPNWEENELGIVFTVKDSRAIERSVVDENRRRIHDLMPSDDINRYGAFCECLRLLCSGYSKNLDSRTALGIVREYSDVKCSFGQKTSRAINAVCKKFGVSEHPEYNERFAKLADSLNPLSIERKAVLSVNPCDYLQMSYGNSWRSCHALDGEYRSGTLSYMNDPYTMIFYTFENGVSSDYCMRPKIRRQVFAYGDGILLQSALYPSYDEQVADTYREVVQLAISQCLGEPNLWALRRGTDHVSDYVGTHCDYTHYKDYECCDKHPNVSILKSIDGAPSITVGHRVYCLSCGYSHTFSDSLYCDGCDVSEYDYCENCEGRFHRNDLYYVEYDGFYCSDCSTWCEHCDNRVVETSLAYNSNGNEVYVCQRCLDNDFARCYDCGDYFENVTYVEGNGEDVCDRCLESYYAECHHCGEYFVESDMTEVDYDRYCDRCLSDKYDMCCDCGEYVESDFSIEILGDIYCEDCAEKRLEEPAIDAA